VEEMKKILLVILFSCCLSCQGAKKSPDEAFTVDFDVMASPSPRYPIKIHHLVVDFWDCFIPEESHILETILRQAAIKSGATPLEFVIHKFEPCGVSVILVLAESHISIHYWQEEKYAAIDIFTCGACDPVKALEHLKEMFIPTKVEYREIERPHKGTK
jgi:S-adenosylmethionine decarboxylase